MSSAGERFPQEPYGPADHVVGIVPGTVDSFIAWVLDITADLATEYFPVPPKDEPPIEGWTHLLPPQVTKLAYGVRTLTWEGEYLIKTTRSEYPDRSGECVSLGPLVQIKGVPAPGDLVRAHLIGLPRTFDQYGPRRVWPGSPPLNHFLRTFPPQVEALPGFRYDHRGTLTIYPTEAGDRIMRVYRFHGGPGESEDGQELSQDMPETPPALPATEPQRAPRRRGRPAGTGQYPGKDAFLYALRVALRASRAKDGRAPTKEQIAQGFRIGVRTLDAWLEQADTSWLAQLADPTTDVN